MTADDFHPALTESDSPFVMCETICAPR